MLTNIFYVVHSPTKLRTLVSYVVFCVLRSFYSPFVLNYI